MARMAAVEVLSKDVWQTTRSVCVSSVEGEDGLGSPSLYRFTAEHPDLLQAEGCIWDEGYRDTRERPVISLGFKGITFLELRAHGARTDLHSKWGTIVPNPAWRLVQALATITSPKGVITIDGFSSHIAPISGEDLEALKAIELDEAGLKREFRINDWVRCDERPRVGQGAYLRRHLHDLRHSNRSHRRWRQDRVAEHCDGASGFSTGARSDATDRPHTVAETSGRPWLQRYRYY